MKKQTLYILLLAGIILLAGCAPKVVGKRKHKKIRDCGCELLQNPSVAHDSLTVYFSEIK
ncbi:MAG: hypothetical protein IKP54_07585 [Bacteroidales bacterium]|nr:hypothetical protein [Bacteroidales bacterium]MBR6063997.1 hypothetical protein [Bacteroidales bacterium]